jgi:inorganic phosphate transporter, PiT family
MKEGMESIFVLVLLGLIFDYTNGFHDASNVVATVIATKALSPVYAIGIASILNGVGAIYFGAVAHTMMAEIVNPYLLSPALIFATLMGAILWNMITWYFGMPSSSSYSLIGAMVGSAGGVIGWNAVLWKSFLMKVIVPMIVSPLGGFFLALVVMRFLVKAVSENRQTSQRLFRYFQIGSSSLVAIAHGLNDAQKSMGMITLALFTSGVIGSLVIPFWVVIACALAMAIGTASGGWRIIRTVGFRITDLKPSQGFAVEMCASTVILTASFLGMPISSTHMIVGSVAGVGAAQGKKSVRWKVARQMGVAWILTLPASAALAWGLYYLLSFWK